MEIPIMHEQQQPDNEPTHSTSDERVGYCNPPKHTRFQKGVSGNPKGRPKGKRNLKSQMRDVLFKRVLITEFGKRRGVPALVAIALLQRQRAISGNVRAAGWGFKQADDLGFLKEPTGSSVDTKLCNDFFSRLSDSAVDEWDNLFEDTNIG
jgi:hypothetical protein